MSNAAPTTSEWYRLTNTFTGSGYALDVVNDDGQDSSGTLQMAATGSYSGQYWQIQPYPTSSSSTYALSTWFLGTNRRLDINGSITPYLSDGGDSPGQIWTISSWDDGTWKLSNQETGDGMFFDVYSDTWAPFMDGGDHTGQHWIFTQLEAVQGASTSTQSTQGNSAPATGNSSPAPASPPPGNSSSSSYNGHSPAQGGSHDPSPSVQGSPSNSSANSTQSNSSQLNPIPGGAVSNYSTQNGSPPGSGISTSSSWSTGLPHNTNSPSSPQQDIKKTHTGVVAGGIAGGVVLICVVAFLLYLIWTRKRPAGSGSTEALYTPRVPKFSRFVPSITGTNWVPHPVNAPSARSISSSIEAPSIPAMSQTTNPSSSQPPTLSPTSALSELGSVDALMASPVSIPPRDAPSHTHERVDSDPTSFSPSVSNTSQAIPSSLSSSLPDASRLNDEQVAFIAGLYRQRVPVPDIVRIVENVLEEEEDLSADRLTVSSQFPVPDPRRSIPPAYVP